MSDLCEYAVNESRLISVFVRCKITGDNCGMYRYCTNTLSPVMNHIYNESGCSLKKNYTEENAVGRKKKETVLNVDTAENIKSEQVESNDMKTIDVISLFVKNDKTCVRYKYVDGMYYNIFINGVYHGNLKIDYFGDRPDINNVIRVY